MKENRDFMGGLIKDLRTENQQETEQSATERQDLIARNQTIQDRLDAFRVETNRTILELTGALNKTQGLYESLKASSENQVTFWREKSIQDNNAVQDVKVEMGKLSSRCQSGNGEIEI
jgi:ABC-type phosphate transport system auxiliary subunit